MDFGERLDIRKGWISGKVGYQERVDQGKVGSGKGWIRDRLDIRERLDIEKGWIRKRLDQG